MLTFVGLQVGAAANAFANNQDAGSSSVPVARNSLPTMSPGGYCPSMAVQRSELRLVWPAKLFAAEASALLAAGADDDALGGLLAEAFHGGRAELLLKQVGSDHPYNSNWADPDPWDAASGFKAQDPGPYTSRATARLVSDLVEDAESMPRYVPRALYRQRQQPAAAALTVPECKDAFARAVAELVALGYFEEAFGTECDDSHDDPAAQGQRILSERLGIEVPLWPLSAWSDGSSGPTGFHEGWSTEVFFDVIEALDELVARPRQRRWHGFHGDWDYEDYAREVGQAVYRWRVNELLDRSNAPLRLAEAGLDAGLLVSAAHDDRDQLADRALNTPDAKDRSEVEHAVKLFRGRDSTREDKRSALTTLGRVLGNTTVNHYDGLTLTATWRRGDRSSRRP
jgi:hypothetical protein